MRTSPTIHWTAAVFVLTAAAGTAQPWTSHLPGRECVGQIETGLAGSRVVLAAGTHGIFRTTDGGENWTLAPATSGFTKRSG